MKRLVFRNNSIEVELKKFYNCTKFYFRIKGVLEHYEFYLTYGCGSDIDSMPKFVKEFIFGKKFRKFIHKGCAARLWQNPFDVYFSVKLERETSEKERILVKKVNDERKEKVYLFLNNPTREVWESFDFTDFKIFPKNQESNTFHIPGFSKIETTYGYNKYFYEKESKINLLLNAKEKIIQGKIVFENWLKEISKLGIGYYIYLPTEIPYLSLMSDNRLGLNTPYWYSFYDETIKGIEDRIIKIS